MTTDDRADYRNREAGALALATLVSSRFSSSSRWAEKSGISRESGAAGQQRRHPQPSRRSSRDNPGSVESGVARSRRATRARVSISFPCNRLSIRSGHPRLDRTGPRRNGNVGRQLIHLDVNWHSDPLSVPTDFDAPNFPRVGGVAARSDGRYRFGPGRHRLAQVGRRRKRPYPAGSIRSPKSQSGTLLLTLSCPADP